MPRNSGHAAKPVFFEAVENNTAGGGDFKVADQPHAQGSLFWDTSAASNKQPHPKQQALSFGPARPDIFFKPSAGAKPSLKSQQQATSSTNGASPPHMRSSFFQSLTDSCALCAVRVMCAVRAVCF
jgi:hypothetical protein